MDTNEVIELDLKKNANVIIAVGKVHCKITLVSTTAIVFVTFSGFSSVYSKEMLRNTKALVKFCECNEGSNGMRLTQMPSLLAKI